MKIPTLKKHGGSRPSQHTRVKQLQQILTGHTLTIAGIVAALGISTKYAHHLTAELVRTGHVIQGTEPSLNRRPALNFTWAKGMPLPEPAIYVPLEKPIRKHKEYQAVKQHDPLMLALFAHRLSPPGDGWMAAL